MDTFYVRVIRRIDVVRRHVPRLGPDMVARRLLRHPWPEGRAHGGQDVASGEATND